MLRAVHFRIPGICSTACRKISCEIKLSQRVLTTSALSLFVKKTEAHYSVTTSSLKIAASMLERGAGRIILLPAREDFREMQGREKAM